MATQASWDALLRASHKAEPAPHPSLEAGQPASLTWDGASQLTGVCPGWAPGPTAAPAQPGCTSRKEQTPLPAHEWTEDPAGGQRLKAKAHETRSWENQEAEQRP